MQNLLILQLKIITGKLVIIVNNKNNDNNNILPSVREVEGYSYNGTRINIGIWSPGRGDNTLISRSVRFLRSW